MTKRALLTITGVLTMAGMATLPAPARAQTQDGGAEAARLEQEAAKLYESPRSFKRAARLHERAADLHPAGDLRRVDNLRMAARLYHYAGEAGLAREAMVHAADAAHASGDVMTAAATYIDAAFLFQDAGEPEMATRLTSSARLLTNSPLISSRDRETILARLRVST